MVWMLNTSLHPNFSVIQSVKLQKILIGSISAIFQKRARKPCFSNFVSQPFIREMTIMQMYIYGLYMNFYVSYLVQLQVVLNLEGNMFCALHCGIAYDFYYQKDTVMQVHTSLIIPSLLTCGALLHILRLPHLNTMLEVRRP